MTDQIKQNTWLLIIAALLGTGGGSGVSAILDNDEALLQKEIVLAQRQEDAQWQAINDLKSSMITEKDMNQLIELYMLRKQLEDGE